MTKQKKINEKLKVIEKHLAAAEDYVAKNVNVRGTASWLHLGDWKGKSGHPLWMKNHMIPSIERVRAKKERALEMIDMKGKQKSLKERKRPSNALSGGE